MWIRKILHAFLSFNIIFKWLFVQVLQSLQGYFNLQETSNEAFLLSHWMFTSLSGRLSRCMIERKRGLLSGRLNERLS